MLAAMESGAVKTAVTAPPVTAVYLALTCHIWRTAGWPQWNWNDPEYRVDADGILRRQGSFSRPSSIGSGRWFKGKIFAVAWHSSTFRHIYNRFYQQFYRQGELETFAAVTAAARDWVQTNYPGTIFEVIWWPEKPSDNAAVLPLLKAHGLNITPIETILPDFHKDETKYRIPGDGHPNVLAHRLIGEYIATHFLPVKPSQK